MIRLFLIFFALFAVGCSGFGMKMKSLVSGKSVKEIKSASAGIKTASAGPKKFSQNPNMPYRVPRQYRRMTQEKMEREAELGSDSGSLWTMEGQSGYLFSQNRLRRVGDLINIKLDGSAEQSLQTKVDVITKMLRRLDGRKRKRIAQQRAKVKTNVSQTGGEAKPPEAAAETAQNAGASSRSPASSGELQVEEVPTKVVERLIDGNYRVRGNQPFMIGKREFKVIVSGVVRSEDFSDQGIKASKLLDPKFDIVSVRKPNL